MFDDMMASQILHWTGRRVIFLWLKSRRGAGSATDWHYGDAPLSHHPHLRRFDGRGSRERAGRRDRGVWGSALAPKRKVSVGWSVVVAGDRHNYDADGKALLDEFGDAVIACVSARGAIHFEIVSVATVPVGG